MSSGVTVCGSSRTNWYKYGHNCHSCHGEAFYQQIQNIVLYNYYLYQHWLQFTLCIGCYCQTLGCFATVAAMHHVRMFPLGVTEVHSSQRLGWLRAGALLGGSVGVSSLNASDWRSAEKRKRVGTICLSNVWLFTSHATSQHWLPQISTVTPENVNLTCLRSCKCKASLMFMTTSIQLKNEASGRVYEFCKVQHRNTVLYN